MRLDRLRLVAILAAGQIVGWGTTFGVPRGRSHEPGAGRSGLLRSVARDGIGGALGLIVPCNAALVEREGVGARRSIGSPMIHRRVGRRRGYPRGTVCDAADLGPHCRRAAGGLALAAAFADGQASLLHLFIAFYGFGSGISALTRALLPLGFFSASCYARAAANLSLPGNIAMAPGPLPVTVVPDSARVAGVALYASSLAMLALATLGGLAALAGRRPAQATPA